MRWGVKRLQGRGVAQSGNQYALPPPRSPLNDEGNSCCNNVLGAQAAEPTPPSIGSYACWRQTQDTIVPHANTHQTE